jgi:hypothetical protein
MLSNNNARIILCLSCLLLFISFRPNKPWHSKWINLTKAGKLEYIPDEKGNTIPDFSRVGYFGGDRSIPTVDVMKTITPSASGVQEIQEAIDALSKQAPDKNGFRGAVLLKKGTYKLSAPIRIETGGIVLRGEGKQTKLVAEWKNQDALIQVSGKGSMREVAGSRTKITDAYVPVGSHSFSVASAAGYAPGDHIIVYRPGTDQWIKDLKMDQIEARNGTKQWQADEYNLNYERVITRVEGNKIFIDNPIVMAMEPKYGIGEIFKYTFEGRITQVGIEDLYCESVYDSDTAENHAWDAVHFNRIEQGWVRNVQARYFGYSCVNLSNWAKNISVLNCGCFDHKSVITGGRRYSFNNDGQQNLFMDCQAGDGRHDYVTGARVCGPNVFVNCSAIRTHADIGPHHRWATGTLYDNIITDGEINIQDRGNYGSGHGWVGVTQILWNCRAKSATVQSPYVNGKNYCIGLRGKKAAGRFKDRPDGEWEGQNVDGLEPVSLYKAQLAERRRGM